MRSRCAGESTNFGVKDPRTWTYIIEEEQYHPLIFAEIKAQRLQRRHEEAVRIFRQTHHFREKRRVTARVAHEREGSLSLEEVGGWFAIDRGRRETPSPYETLRKRDDHPPRARGRPSRRDSGYYTSGALVTTPSESFRTDLLRDSRYCQRAPLGRASTVPEPSSRLTRR